MNFHSLLEKKQSSKFGTILRLNQVIFLSLYNIKSHSLKMNYYPSSHVKHFSAVLRTIFPCFIFSFCATKTLMRSSESVFMEKLSLYYCELHLITKNAIRVCDFVTYLFFPVTFLFRKISYLQKTLYLRYI